MLPTKVYTIKPTLPPKKPIHGLLGYPGGMHSTLPNSVMSLNNYNQLRFVSTKILLSTTELLTSCEQAGAGRSRQLGTQSPQHKLAISSVTDQRGLS